MSVNAPTRTQRRWQQLSLRAILLLMLVAAVAIWMLTSATPDEVLIQGQWDITSVTNPANGNQPKPGFSGSGYEFRGSTIINLPDNRAQFDLKLMPEEHRLKAFMIHNDEVDKNVFHDGFYFLEGDTLKFCFCDPNLPDFQWGERGEFPQQFASKTYALIEMKRKQR